MIKFFRQIRYKLMKQNNTTRYFKYALGEIILVVIGILIALQINNWNEGAKEQEKVQSYLKNLTLDLEQDINETERQIRSIKYKVIFVDSIASYFRDKEINELNNLDVFYNAFDYYGYRPLTWYKNTIEELRNSGTLKSIKNDSIRLMINQYYALTDHLDQDYKEDHERSEAINDKVFKIINTNYPRAQDLIDTLFLSYRENNKSIFTNSKVFKTAKQADLALLTNDMNDIHIYVNDLLNYKRNLTVRYKYEFPKLINNAKTIIRLIEEEYND